MSEFGSEYSHAQGGIQCTIYSTEDGLQKIISRGVVEVAAFLACFNWWKKIKRNPQSLKQTLKKLV